MYSPGIILLFCAKRKTRACLLLEQQALVVVQAGIGRRVQAFSTVGPPVGWAGWALAAGASSAKSPSCAARLKT